MKIKVSELLKTMNDKKYQNKVQKPKNSSKVPKTDMIKDKIIQMLSDESPIVLNCAILKVTLIFDSMHDGENVRRLDLDFIIIVF